MKKLFPVILLVAVAAVVWFISTSHDSAARRPGETPTAKEHAVAGDSNTAALQPRTATTSGQTAPAPQPEDDDSLDAADVKPATELYKSAAEAFEAVQKGSVDYDDLVLEQFAELGEDCGWCPEFYQQVKDAMLSPEASQDQKSYYAEVLAMSGRVDNVGSLVDAVQNAPNQETAEVFAEALEVTAGDDQTVRYLGEQLSTDNPLLKESIIAAITNHGSRLAVETLYRKTVEGGDPDGFYSLGIGLGEVIPDEESLPLLTELASKRDSYSNLAVKALLNYGPEGLKIVNDILTNSKDAEVNRQLLQDAEDHVNYDEQTEKALKEIAENSKSPDYAKFAQDRLAEFATEEKDDEGGTLEVED